MTNGNYGPHSNPIWSTFIFVIGMVLFLFYLETMIKPMDFLSSKSFVVHDYHRQPYRQQLLPANHSRLMTFDDVTHGSFDLNHSGNTLVMLHIQKTAGKSFSAHIALDIDPATGPKCNCTNTSSGVTPDSLEPGSCQCSLEDGTDSMWFYNRLTVGWPCGVHPGWTDLTINCLDGVLNNQEHREIGRRYAMMTMLRTPLVRYVNEWHHVSEQEQWPFHNLKCHPLEGTNHFQGVWTNLKMDEFIRCPENPANNRQVRMLADLNLLTCSDVTDALSRSDHLASSGRVNNSTNVLLESAKHNLRRLAFFGLIEFLPESERLFEYTFGVRFKKPLWGVDSTLSVKLTAEQKYIIGKLNKLDGQLYQFAKELFFERLNTLSSLFSKLPYMTPKMSHRRTM